MSFHWRAQPHSVLKRPAALACFLSFLLLLVAPALALAASPALAPTEDDSSVALRKGGDDDDDNSGSGNSDDDDDDNSGSGSSTGGDDNSGDDNGGDDNGGDDNGGDDNSGDDNGGDDNSGDDNGGDDNGGDDNSDDDNGGDDNGGDDNSGDDNGGDDNGVSKAGLIKFDQRSFVASEGQGVAVITVERSKGERGAVSVEYMTQSDSATAGSDYEDTSGTLAWGPGDGSVRSFRIPLNDDSETEGPETVQLMLFGATGGATVSAERGTAVLSIIDNESPGVGSPGEDNNRAGVIKFDQRSFQVIESAGVANVLIERSKGESGAVTVSYRTSDGSAEDGLDYSGTTGTVRWAAGDGTARLVQVPILDDDLDEGGETVNLELFDARGGASLDPERRIATLQILDDDTPRSNGCSSSSTTLCLQNRFAVEVVWRRADGGSGKGRAVGLSQRSGLFWFFNENNIEMLFKTVDGCAAGLGAHWMYYAATTNVDFTVSVTDTRTGITKQYSNQLGAAALPVQDTDTFAFCLP